MKKLILVAGLPGVGKSTISRRVSEITGARIVDIDDFKKVDTDPTLVKNQVDPPELRWLYYKKALKYVFDLFDSGVSTVVMDEVFHLNSLRSQMEALCAERQVQVLWVEVLCSYDTVEKRLSFKSREGHILSTEEALKMNILFKGIFESFSIDCRNHVTVYNDSEESIDNCLAQIMEGSLMIS